MEEESSKPHRRRRRLIIHQLDEEEVSSPITATTNHSESNSVLQNEVNSTITLIKNTTITEQLDLDITYDISHIPETVLLEIIIRLPVKSIFKFKCVSKHWLSLISHPSFCRSFLTLRNKDVYKSFRIVYRYLHLPKFTDVFDRLNPYYCNSLDFSVLFLSTLEEQLKYEQFKVLGSCNGLILICLLGPIIYYVCDPVTRNWVTLHRDMGISRPNRRPVYFGEGIVSKVDQENVLTSYVVVRVEWVDTESQYLKLETYSSEIGEWIEHSLLCSKPILLLRRGGGPLYYNGYLHWFVRSYGMVAFDPYADDSETCHLISFPEDRDIESENIHDGLYRLCAECQGDLKFFEVSPDCIKFHCFSMWVLKDYDEGKWDLEFKVTRSDLWSDDSKLSDCLMMATFVPLSFHPFDSDVVYLRCVELSSVVSYNIMSKRLDVSRKTIGDVEGLSWRVVIPYVLPTWPRPVPLVPKNPKKVAAKKEVNKPPLHTWIRRN